MSMRHPKVAPETGKVGPQADRVSYSPFSTIQVWATSRTFARRSRSSRPNELLADTKSTRDLGVRLGDSVTMRVLSRDTVWDELDSVDFSVDPRKASGGPLVRMRVVGVAAFWKSDLENGYVYLTPDVATVGFGGFARIREAVDIGYRTAMTALVDGW